MSDDGELTILESHGGTQEPADVAEIETVAEVESAEPQDTENTEEVGENYNWEKAAKTWQAKYDKLQAEAKAQPKTQTSQAKDDAIEELKRMIGGLTTKLSDIEEDNSVILDEIGQAQSGEPLDPSKPSLLQQRRAAKAAKQREWERATSMITGAGYDVNDAKFYDCKLSSDPMVAVQQRIVQLKDEKFEQEISKLRELITGETQGPTKKVTVAKTKIESLEPKEVVHSGGGAQNAARMVSERKAAELRKDKFDIIRQAFNDTGQDASNLFRPK